MRLIRSFIAALLGGLLLYIAMIELRGFLAARATPAWYFPSFGKENTELALAVWGVLVHVIPEGLFIACAMLVVVRLLAKGPGTPLKPVIAGMVACYLALLFAYGANFSSIEWWSLPTAVSPLIGLLLGVWLCARIAGAAHADA